MQKGKERSGIERGSHQERWDHSREGEGCRSGKRKSGRLFQDHVSNSGKTGRADGSTGSLPGKNRLPRLQAASPVSEFPLSVLSP